MRLWFGKRITGVMMLCGISIMIVLLGGIWAYVKFSHIAGPVILSFTKEEGIKMVGNSSALGGMWGVGLVMIMINTVLALALDRRDMFLGKLTAVVTLLLSILIFIGIAAIISVN